MAKNYIDNDELTEEIMKCKANNNIVSDKLAKMFLLLAQHQADGMKHYESEDDKQDCIAQALHDLCRDYCKFELGKGQAFSFLTNITYFGICGALRQLYPKKYKGTVRMTFTDDDGKRENTFEF